MADYGAIPLLNNRGEKSNIARLAGRTTGSGVPWPVQARELIANSR
jgi:hypothetical protein